MAVVTSGCDGAVHEQGQEYLDDAEGCPAGDYVLIKNSHSARLAAC